MQQKLFLCCFLLSVQPSWLVEAHINIKSSWPKVQRIRRPLGTQDIVISSSLSSFTENGQFTQVTVQDSRGSLDSSTRSGHLLALYPSPSNPTKTIPVTFRNISSMHPAYITTGVAQVPIKLINIRSPGFVLRLMLNSPIQPVVLAESAVIRNTIPHAPGQVHLAQHADGQSIVVQWVSGSNAPQQLEYDTQPWSTQHTSKSRGDNTQQTGIKSVTSSSHSYTIDLMCGPPANSFGYLAPGYLHTAVLPAADVGHGQQLHYRVGSCSVGWTPLHSFTSAPTSEAVAAGQASFTFLVFNDVGQENAVLFDDVCPPYCPAGWSFVPYTTNSTKLLRHLLTETDARLGLLVGDIAYADGYLVDWDYFGYQFEPAFSKWPLMVAPGNHEKDASGSANVPGNHFESGGECGVPYTYRYYTPAWHTQAQPGAATQQAALSTSKHDTKHQATVQQPSSKANLPGVQAEKATSNSPSPSGILSPSTARSFYSFEMGGVHFVLLDTEAPSEPDSPQGRFVADDLAQVDRQHTPWLVVGLHRQMVGPTTDEVNVKTLTLLQHNLEDLFLKHEVDLVLQGHDHAYARTCPYAKGNCTTRPSRGAGRTSSKGDASIETVTDPTSPIYILAGHAGAGFTHAFPSPLPPWVVFGAQDRNGYLRVRVTGHAMTVVSVSTDDGRIMDGVIIRKKPRS